MNTNAGNIIGFDRGWCMLYVFHMIALAYFILLIGNNSSSFNKRLVELIINHSGFVKRRDLKSQNNIFIWGISKVSFSDIMKILLTSKKTFFNVLEIQVWFNWT